ncbi:hypothetical protein ACQJBY_028283 [Aegilops geniculata]
MMLPLLPSVVFLPLLFLSPSPPSGRAPATNTRARMQAGGGASLEQGWLSPRSCSVGMGSRRASLLCGPSPEGRCCRRRGPMGGRRRHGHGSAPHSSPPESDWLFYSGGYFFIRAMEKAFGSSLAVLARLGPRTKRTICLGTLDSTDAASPGHFGILKFRVYHPSHVTELTRYSSFICFGYFLFSNYKVHAISKDRCTHEHSSGAPLKKF